MAIPDPPKAGSPFCALWTGGWNPKTPKINNFFIPEITLRGGYEATGATAGHARSQMKPAAWRNRNRDLSQADKTGGCPK